MGEGSSALGMRRKHKQGARAGSGLRTLAAILAALALMIVFVQEALAQELGPLAGAAQREDAAEAEAPAPESVRPALPDAFTPMVGPVIKRYYPDVVDRRTTAFLPASLDHLTPIDMPDTDETWVRVDLSEQLLVAYEGDRPIRAFVIASGLPDTPTVTGEFRIRMKVRSQLMEGGDPAKGNDYYLPNVEWVQYFYKDYGLHGTYWHYSFGTPRSHGCINMTNADAKWLWDFLGPVWDGHTIWQRSTEDNPGSIVIVTE